MKIGLLEAVQDTVKGCSRWPFEAKAKHGVQDHIMPFPQACAKHFISFKKWNPQTLQLLDQAMIKRLVCLLWIAHLITCRQQDQACILEVQSVLRKRWLCGQAAGTGNTDKESRKNVFKSVCACNIMGRDDGLGGCHLPGAGSQSGGGVELRPTHHHRCCLVR